FRINDMKLYDDRHLTADNQIDLANGLRLSASVSYMQSHLLDNHSKYSFFFWNVRNYTSNIPNNAFFHESYQTQSKSFSITAGLQYTPEYFYHYVNFRKIMVLSKYPTFNLNYKAAIPGILGSNSLFQTVWGGVSQRIETENKNMIRYSLEAGWFYEVKDILFIEFKHFNTQPIPVQLSNFENSFQLLTYYQYSTSQKYIEGHFQYQTDLLFLKRMPWISNRLWT